MATKCALILAAGFGTRMGELGKTLPKPLWPVFEMAMLEIHILTLKEMGIEKIFVNTHHQADVIHKFMDEVIDEEDVICIHEDEILGSGGAIHNLYSRGVTKGRLFIQNADIFFETGTNTYELLSQSMESKSTTSELLAVSVGPSTTYNRLLVEEGVLRDIVPPSSVAPTITYSGVGLIDLDYLNYIAGQSGFFSTVANFQKTKVGVTSPTQMYEYWDFGTKREYLNSHIKLLRSEKSSFRSRLERIGAIKKTKINGQLNSYDTQEKDCIWLAQKRKSTEPYVYQGSDGTRIVI